MKISDFFDPCPWCEDLRKLVLQVGEKIRRSEFKVHLADRDARELRDDIVRVMCEACGGKGRVIKEEAREVLKLLLPHLWELHTQVERAEEVNHG